MRPRGPIGCFCCGSCNAFFCVKISSLVLSDEPLQLYLQKHFKSHILQERKFVTLY